MLNNSSQSEPTLAPPGKGLPKLELFLARLLVKQKLKHISEEKNLALFRSESEQILTLARQVDPLMGSKRVLIRRLRGLEDSSRYWSVYMTLEHLLIVNRVIIQVITLLMQGQKPQFVSSTAAVKPTPGTDAAVIPLMESVCEEFEQVSHKLGTLDSPTTFPHPWFGELNAKEWQFFAGFHMALHRKQITLIIKGLKE